MDTKELKIQVPDGYEIDKENSTFECVKFKPIKKDITYDDICNNLFAEKLWCSYITTDGCIRTNIVDSSVASEKNNATNKKQLEKILALNQLLNIAEYYNRNHNNKNDWPYCISYQVKDGYKVYCYPEFTVRQGATAIFNNALDAQAVIDNPNFREILDIVYKTV